MHSHLQSNLALLLQIWLERSSGQLHLGDDSPAPLSFADGAPVAEADFARLQGALLDRALAWEPAPLPGRGNRRRLGALLGQCSRKAKIQLRPARRGRPSLDPLGQELRGLELPLLLPEPDPEQATQERLLSLGRRCAEAGDFAAAEAHLNSAVGLRLDHPRALAWLAWARLNNPTAPARERRVDALRWMNLALQLDGGDPEVLDLAARLRHEGPRGAEASAA